ncbi:MAG: NAD(P)-dependent glycerol-3-phosphate dehydrogenase [Puniceicoccales bacterium]|jgi:glycerol-3-phosphate dehydrogenase (NAD(P)+)|nr:NAD(P)-dependent glycerol-3-phosphate dehydrogenase [Puniceicoccales bacterium]
MNFCVFGAGAWGTAIAIHLHRAGHSVTLVPRRVEHAAALATTRENTGYLPGFFLHEDIQIACEPRPPLMEADVAILACPSHGLRELATRLSAVLDTAWRVRIFISLTKGLEQKTLLRPSQVLAQALPNHLHGVLSGPSNAAEVARGLPGAVVFATDHDDDIARLVQEAISDTTVRVYRSTDIAGVELGGILKNIYAIGAGISDGLAFGSNAKASYLTRAMHEMERLGIAAGGKSETFFGLSGVGDLIATAHGDWSRNRALGAAIARTGETAATYLASQHSVVEGYPAAACFHQLARERGVSAPILEALYAVLYKGISPREGVAALMQRIACVE